MQINQQPLQELTIQDNLIGFFKLAFGKIQGYLCVAFIHPETREFTEKFFPYPMALKEVADTIRQRIDHENVYFCPQLFNNRVRQKGNVKAVTCAWADLDTCHPDQLLVQPSVVIESSPNRWQALWFLEKEIEPQAAELLSRKIAYFHKKDGADLSGWDLTQLLRVPGTKNFKYPDTPTVAITEVADDASKANAYALVDFKVYPEYQQYVVGEGTGDDPVPDTTSLENGGTPLELMNTYREHLNPLAFMMWEEMPEDNRWSDNLRALEMFLFEAGLPRAAVYYIVKDSACNKYRRDGRPDEHLWRDVCRAHQHHVNNIYASTENPERMKPLLTEEERKSIMGRETFVEKYIAWASEMSDAAKAYHQAGAFVMLSTLLCGNVVLPTSFGTMIPNLWFMILGSTTITRKSTSMDMAMDMLEEVDDEAVLATDGTIEGMMGILSTRGGRPSVFLRDEFSGMLDSMIKKDYMAGMPEMLTKLYDGKMMKRVLKKEIIQVRDPRLIMYTGGIKSKITQTLTLEHVSSGFMPRFIFITAESDVARIKPLGPPEDVSTMVRDSLINDLRAIKDHYQASVPMVIGESEVVLPVNVEHKAILSKEAWIRYNKLEMDLVKAGMDSDIPVVLTPVGDRLAKSILKAAVLIAASRQFRTDHKIAVTLEDMLHAIRYGETWKQHAEDVISRVGISGEERIIDGIIEDIKNSGVVGVTRSTILRKYKLSARQGKEILDTIVQRGIVHIRLEGRHQAYVSNIQSRK